MVNETAKLSSSEGLELQESHARNQIVAAEILAERRQQFKKWGAQNHSVDRWLVILGEEFGEACHAAFNIGRIESAVVYKGSIRAFKQELIQTAAVAMAIATAIDEYL